MIYREDGQPVKGAYLSQTGENKVYQEWVDKELALYPDNYLAYRSKWRRNGKVDRESLKTIIEADIKQVNTQIVGEPLDWLHTMVGGYLSLGQEEKSREVLRRMMEKYPDAPLTGESLFRYMRERYAQHFTGTGTLEVNQMTLIFMKRKAASEQARWLAELSLFRDKAQPLEVPEMVLRRWIADEPQNPDSYLALASALSEREQRPEQVALLSEKALELLLQSKAQEDDWSATRIEQVDLPRTYYLQR